MNTITAVGKFDGLESIAGGFRMKDIKNESAYPSNYSKMNDPEYGLTKREYFAGLAMQGLLSGNRVLMSNTAAEAVRIADCLLVELGKGNG